MQRGALDSQRGCRQRADSETSGRESLWSEGGLGSGSSSACGLESEISDASSGGDVAGEPADNRTEGHALLPNSLFELLLLREPTLAEVGEELLSEMRDSCCSLGRLIRDMGKGLLEKCTPLSGRRQRDLLPLPFSPFDEVRALCGGDVRPLQKRRVAAPPGLNSWLCLLVSALNFCYSLGGSQRHVRLHFGPPTVVQQAALENLAAEVRRFLRQLPGPLPRGSWEEVLSEKAVTYTGEEVYTAERLHWDRVVEALPPAHACAAVDAAEVSEGGVKECLLHPEFIMKEVADRGPRPRTPRVWASRVIWEKLAGNLVKRGLLEPIEWDDIGEVDGRKILGGCFGVHKAGRATRTGPQRLVMNVIPANWMQWTIEGDMGLLPNSSQWHGLVPRSGEVLTLSAEDLQCAFYVFRLPKVWRRWFAFEMPVPRQVVGLPGAGHIHVTSAVVPMGWISATGVIQHIHRRLLRCPRPLEPALETRLEIRRDAPLPRRAREGEAWEPTRGHVS